MSVDQDSINFEVVKGLLQVQESAFRTMVEVMFNGLKDDIKEIYHNSTRQSGKDDIFLPQKNTCQYGIHWITFTKGRS